MVAKAERRIANAALTDRNVLEAAEQVKERYLKALRDCLLDFLLSGNATGFS